MHPPDCTCSDCLRDFPARADRLEEMAREWIEERFPVYDNVARSQERLESLLALLEQARREGADAERARALLEARVKELEEKNRLADIIITDAELSVTSLRQQNERLCAAAVTLRDSLLLCPEQYRAVSPDERAAWDLLWLTQPEAGPEEER